ncbi:DNA primase [candidate division KSB1 bacterium]|nr:DNA primase [candidate division KSB1 bacterium]
MSGIVSQDKISQVREATDIVDLISNYLTLKKAGKSFVGLCPFHTDSAPSFHVYPNDQHYYCFGCQKGGDVFNFLMEMEKMTFKEALEFLAEKSGISLPTTQVDHNREKEKEALFFANRWAANLFYKNLMSPAGKIALEYIQKRGITQKTIKDFGLGYSLPGWDGLIQQAKKDSVSLEVLFKAGLVIRKDNGGYYDRFRGRFMIPIVNLYKKVLGFGGRIIVADEKNAKYINSPETPIYHKGYVLFGIYQSRQPIREKDRAIFVEGYTDLISMYQSGIKNVVATSGTALTPNQARLIKRYTENITLLYDADTAGSLAAMRGADIFLDEGLEVNIVTLPSGSDPDSYIQAHGAIKFKELLEHSFSIIQFKINTLTKKYDSSTSQGTSQIINELLSSIGRIKNSIKQNLAVKEVAEHFRLDERAVMQQLDNIKRTGRIQPTTIERQQNSEKPKQQKKSKYDIAEEDLLRLVLEDANWLPKIFQYLQLDEIQNREHRELFAIILGLFQQNESFEKKDVVSMITDPETSSKIADILTKKIGSSADRQQLFEDCLMLLKKRKLETRMFNLTQEIKIAQDKEQDASEYIKKYQQCREDIRRVETREFLKE